MQYKRVKISAAEHNAFILPHKYGSYNQSTWYANAERFRGYTDVCWADVADNNGVIVGGTAAKLKKIPHTPFYYAYLRFGFVLDYDREDWQDILAALWQALLEACREKRVIYMKFDVNVTEDRTDVFKFFTDQGCGHTPLVESNKPYTYFRYRSFLDISLPEDELLKSLPRKTRWMINKTEKFGLHFEFGGKEDLKIFQALKEETGKRDSILTYDFETTSRIFDTLTEAGIGKLVLVRLDASETLAFLREDLAKWESDLAKQKKKSRVNTNLISDIHTSIDKLNAQIAEMAELERTHPEGIYLSASLIVEHGKTLDYYLSGSSDLYRDYFPNYFMIWQMIRHAKSRGCTTLDMGGTEPDSIESSLGQFKLKWGSVTKAFSGEFDYAVNKLAGSLFRMLMDRKRSTKNK